MEIISLEIVINDKLKVLEAKLKVADNIESFDVDALDKIDERKSVLLSFKEPINVNYINQFLVSILGEHKAKEID